MDGRELISMSEYGRRRGVTEGAVRKAVRTGRITLVNGKIDPVASDAQWSANRDVCQPSKMAAATPLHASAIPNGAPAPAAAPLFQPELEVPGETKESSGASRADAQREYWNIRAQEKQLDLEERKKTLIPLAEFEQAVGDLIIAAKSKLLLIPDKLADRLAVTNDPIACRNMIEHALRETLEELSAYQAVA